MKAVRAFIYSNLFVAIVLSMLTISSYALIDGLVFKWYVPLSVFLGSFVLYTFHRLYKIDFIPIEQLSQRHLFVIEHGQLMRYAMSFAVFIMMLILPNFQADTIVWLVPAGIISVGYTIPILPSRQGWSRFRDIPLTKPLIIAIIVSYLTLAFPVFEQHGIHALLERGFVNAFVERALFLLMVTIPFDLRDIVNDRDAGIETLGTQFGYGNSKRLIAVVLAAWLVMLFLRWFSFDLELWGMYPYLILLVPFIAAFLMMRPSWSDITYIFIFEGMIILYAVTSAWFGLLNA